MPIDETDRTILRMLQQDARLSYRAIGEKVGIRAPSVHARVKRLESDGVIRGYRVDVDPDKVGRPMMAVVTIGLESGRKGQRPRTEEIAALLRKHPEVVEVHAITGEDDLLVKVRVPDVAGLERVLIRILEPLEGVRRTTTMLVVRTMFDRETPV